MGARSPHVIFFGVPLAVFAWEFWWLSVALFIAGIGIAPALAVIFAMVSASVKFSDTAEAYGWVGTGQLIGAALGSAIAGFLIDARGDRRVLGCPAFALLGLLVAASSTARSPTCAAGTPARSPTPSRCRRSRARRHSASSVRFRSGRA